MYEGYTPEYIRRKILDNMENVVSKHEGSFASDMAAAVSYEMSKVYEELDALLSMLFVVGLEGDLLDKVCSDYGIYRNSGATAIGSLIISGQEGARLPTGTLVATLNGELYETTGEGVITADGTQAVEIRSVASGARYNMAASTQMTMYRPFAGITGLTLATDCNGGKDIETDDALRDRLLYRLRNPAALGNEASYRQWALSVEGVGAVNVIPRHAGENTVSVLIAGLDGNRVDDETLAACAAYIEERRPICVNVTVGRLNELVLNIEVTLWRKNVLSTEELLTDVTERFNNYLAGSTIGSKKIFYNQLGALVLNAGGVYNYSSLTINGEIGDIEFTENQVVRLGEVIIHDHPI